MVITCQEFLHSKIASSCLVNIYSVPGDNQGYEDGMNTFTKMTPFSRAKNEFEIIEVDQSFY